MTDQINHTAGPWELRGVDGLFAIAHSGGWVMESDNEQQDRADGTLMAASPDLLAACEAAMRIAILWCPESCSDPLHMEELAVLGALKEKITSAIAKARMEDTEEDKTRRSFQLTTKPLDV